MDLNDQLRQFSLRASQLKDQITTEEATKTSLIMPFFQLLGYDIFNPLQFAPEFTADVGIKKGEKVDYAILKDGKPIILIEAKWCGESLGKHDSQLFRYFGTTPAKFAILTNGIIYRFYTDLDNTNVMDEKPFFEFNVLDVRDSSVHELKKFHNSVFDIELVLNTASELKYSNQLKQYLTQQMQTPSDEFVNFLVSQIYTGRRTQAIIDKFRDTIRNSFNRFINELVNDRIKAALDQTQPKDQQSPVVDEVAATVSVMPDDKIVTTMEELEAFFAIKSIVRDVVSPSRLAYRDTESYMGILLDDNKLKWVCRLQLEGSKKYLIIPDQDKKPVKFNITAVDDIFNYKEKLVEAIKRYL